MKTKIQAALDLLIRADTAGATVIELASCIGSTPDGVRSLLRRLREKGHKVEWRRVVGNKIKLFMAHAAPPDGRCAIPPSVREEARCLAPIIAASGPEGLCYYSLRREGVESWCFRGALRMLRAEQKAFSTRVGMRVFARSEWMDAYIQARKPKPAERVKAEKPAKPARPEKAPKPVKQPKAAKPPKPKKQAPQIVKSAKPWQPPQPKPAQPVIIPPNVKRTVLMAPAFDSRYQCDPRTRVVDGFATMGPGRYLDERRAA